jgi:glycopeptide antibiotics resistance protein
VFFRRQKKRLENRGNNYVLVKKTRLNIQKKPWKEMGEVVLCFETIHTLYLSYLIHATFFFFALAAHI